MNNNLLGNAALRNDFRRALASHHYEMDGARVVLPDAKASFGGVFIHTLNGTDRRVDPNLFPTAALIDVLNVYFRGGTQRTAFYLAPFQNNATPVATLTGATFTSTQGEFTAYSEAARGTWTPPTSAPATPSVDNSASPATFTINVAGSTIWGFGLLTTQPKSDTTGVLVACSQFATARSGLNVGDSLSIKYAFSAAST